jgi:hypothetical protein
MDYVWDPKLSKFPYSDAYLYDLYRRLWQLIFCVCQAVDTVTVVFIEYQTLNTKKTTKYCTIFQRTTVDFVNAKINSYFVPQEMAIQFLYKLDFLMRCALLSIGFYSVVLFEAVKISPVKID